MKKVFSKIALTVVALCMCLVLTGCDLFTMNINKGSGYIGNLPNSGEISSQIEVNTKDESRQLLTRVQAVAQVERAIVAIKMEGQLGSSLGSGVIVDIDGGNKGTNEYYVLTNHHVVSSKGNITLYLADENCRNVGDDDYNEDYMFTGVIGDQIYTDKAVTLVGSDQDSDVAVLKLKTGSRDVEIVEALCPIESYSPMRGEDVFAIGNPSGTLPMSVCAGIISYLDRETLFDSVGYVNCIQIDAPINHGSSGGGLFNLYGELIGITNGGSDSYNSLNYAIPFYGTNGFINIAKQLIATATEDNYGYVTGRWSLGFTTDGSYTGAGVKIGSVVEDSNANDAGLISGDVITAVSYVYAGHNYYKEIQTTSEFKSVYYTMKKQLILGQTFTLKIQRTSYISTIAKDITVELDAERQVIFCDTGVYPQDMA